MKCITDAIQTYQDDVTISRILLRRAEMKLKLISNIKADVDCSIEGDIYDFVGHYVGEIVKLKQKYAKSEENLDQTRHEIFLLKQENVALKARLEKTSETQASASAAALSKPLTFAAPAFASPRQKTAEMMLMDEPEVTSPFVLAPG